MPTPYCFGKCAEEIENEGDGAVSMGLVCAKCAQAIESKGDESRRVRQSSDREILNWEEGGHPGVLCKECASC
jgi:hypothetical protein